MPHPESYEYYNPPEKNPMLEECHLCDEVHPVEDMFELSSGKFACGDCHKQVYLDIYFGEME